MKLRILPDCPDCFEHDLRLIRDAKWIILRCLNCNWYRTFMPPPAEDAIDAAVAAAVAGANSQTR